MNRSTLLFVFMWLLSGFLESLLHAQQSGSDPFMVAIRECEMFVVEYDDPASVRKGMQLYEAVISQYPTEPSLGRAKLGLLHICSTAYTEESLARAKSIAQELANDATTTTEIGRELLRGYVEFQLNAAQGKAFQNLVVAEKLMLNYEAWAKVDEKQAELIRAWTLIGKIYIQAGTHAKAVGYLLQKVKEVQGWILSFNKLWKEDRGKYEELVGLNTSLISALGQAMGPCEDIPVMRAVAKEKAVSSYEPIRNAINSWKSSHPNVQLDVSPKTAPESETQFATTLRDQFDPSRNVVINNSGSEIAAISSNRFSGSLWIAVAVVAIGSLVAAVMAKKKMAESWKR